MGKKGRRGEIKMKEIKEKEELRFSVAGLIMAAFASIPVIISFWAPKEYTLKLIITFLILQGVSFIFQLRQHDIAIKNIKEDIMQLSNACIFILDNQQELYDYINEVEEVPEEETKETGIVSPEDFERFSRGEMTKEELLGIKKAVDKVTKAKTKAS